MILLKIKNIKITLMLLVIFFLALSTIPDQCLALNPKTHRAINERIVKGTFFDQYLKKQLGMESGIESSINKEKIWELFGEGGEQEDSMGVRSFNHFHNPITNTGLSPNYSALTWATLPVGGQGFAPISSWNDVRDYYYRALTATDKTSRNDWFARTFQGVGQIMHLVEDMSVPEQLIHTQHQKQTSSQAVLI